MTTLATGTDIGVSGGHPQTMQHWRRALATSQDAAATMLRELYAMTRPAQAELIVSAACQFECQHCIYPPTFAQHNTSRPATTWRAIATALHYELGISQFVYAGRSMTRGGASFLAATRADLAHAAIGVIDTGQTLLPMADLLAEARLDWIDVSFDGTPEAHDRQRSRDGSFNEAILAAVELSTRELAPQINVLTCATAINVATIAEMTRLLRAHGFQSFFRTPVAGVANVRHHAGLALDAHAVAELAARTLEEAGEIEGCSIELGLFDAEQFAAVRRHAAFRDAVFVDDGHSVAFTIEHGTATVSIRYSPASLTGLREFIVNTDGRVMLPLSMAWGRIPDDRVMGDLAHESPLEIWRRLPGSDSMYAYIVELDRERQMLDGLL